MTSFKTNYKKPKKLSDPYYDFTPCMLNDLLRKSDEELIWSDYANLFGPHLPAGTYEEVMYYLPKAFHYLKLNEEDSLDLVTPIFGFCSINLEKLADDGLSATIKSNILECLNYWIREFRIVHYDKPACLKKGWGINYQDLVYNSDVICKSTSELVRFETLEELAIKFVQSLAYHKGEFTKAAWFLEYSRARFDVYTPPNNEIIQEMLTNKELLNNAYAVVWAEAMEESASPTYWRDTFNRLEI